VKALFAALVLATAAAAATDPTRLVDEIEATSVALAKKLRLRDVGRLTGKPVLAPDAVVLELETVPELLPALADELARHPGIDFAHAKVQLSRTARAAKVADALRVRQDLGCATLRLLLPIAKPDAARGKGRAEVLRHIKGLTTSNSERFLTGELWFFRDLLLEPDGRLSLNVIAASRAKLVSGVKALRHLRDVRVRRVTTEPFRDQTVYSFEVQAIAAPGAPAPNTAALEAAMSFSEAWEKAHAPASEPRAGKMESVRFEAPLPDGRVPIDFNASGVIDVVRQLPALMSAASIDGWRASLAVSMETKVLAMPDATGKPAPRNRLRLTFDATYAPAAGSLRPPPFAPLLELIDRRMTTAEPPFWASAPPVKLRDVRIESDGRVQMNVLGLDLPALGAAFDALTPITSVTIKRFTWEPYRDRTVVSAEISGRLGDATESQPGTVIAAVTKLLASVRTGTPQSLRIDGRSVTMRLATTMIEQPNVEAGLRSVDALAKITSRPVTNSVEVVVQLDLPSLSK
jgi:hypothetical protein